MPKDNKEDKLASSSKNDVVTFLGSQVEFKPVYKSIDYASNPIPDKISKVYKPKKLEIDIQEIQNHETAVKPKKRPGKHSSQLRLPTKVKDNKLVVKEPSGKIAIGNQPRQRNRYN